jgi:hypothetical protein
MNRSLFRLGIWTLAVLTVGVCLGLVATKTQSPHRQVAVPVEAEQPPVQPGQTGPMGWVDDPVAVAAVVAQMPAKSFAETPAFREMADAPDHAYLWEAAAKVLGHPFPPLNQGQVGSCVANGAAGAVDVLQLQQIAAMMRAGRPPPEYKPVSPEVIYAGARVEIGGGRIRGDGAVGAWAIQYCQKKGVVAQQKYPSVDLSAYSEARCRSWGNSGVPKDIDALAAQHPVKDGTPVRTAEEAEKALANGYTVTVASNQGFANQSRRDAQGFLKPNGTWAHQMCVLGYRKGDRPGFLILNSWGPDWVGGPKGDGDPPDGSFWADRAVVDRMFKQGDSFAWGDVKGFPSRKPDAFIKHPDPNRPAFALAY